MRLTRRIKNTLKGGLRTGFELGQRLGVNVLPLHFYSGIPEIASLRSTTEWRRPRPMQFINGYELSKQTAELEAAFQGATKPPDGLYQAAIRENGENGGFGPVEAEALYAFVSSKRPRKIVQVGCGVSTALLLKVIEATRQSTQIVCVEPFPTNFLRRSHAEGKIELVDAPAQAVDLKVLTGLEANDLLFVDSTHTVKAGSEVSRIITEVLPELASGAHVHFHDIYFPYDYARTLLSRDLFFPLESILLHTFLTQNSRYSISFSLSMLHYEQPDAIRRFVPEYTPQENEDGLAIGQTDGKHFPSSTYLRVL